MCELHPFLSSLAICLYLSNPITKMGLESSALLKPGDPQDLFFRNKHNKATLASLLESQGR